MAYSADDQGRALACGHVLDPGGPESRSFALKALPGADVVDLDVIL